jgi:glycosyltransferase involved in cell wall biosynthesis
MTLLYSLISIVNRNWTMPGGGDSLLLVADIVLACSLIPALLFAMNIWFFHRPGRPWNKRLLPPVSVLIPVRNEELSIESAIESVMSSRGVELELIVLDDGSTDRTAEIVRVIAEESPHVRLETAPPLPEGWNGKQHACCVLASLASHDVFCFVDADARIGPEAIYRMVSELNFVEKDETERALVSGFPRQLTGSLLEQLLLPLIHFVLLGFLPLACERWSGRSSFAAGCGQFMMVRREAYYATGGHSANPKTMHDGLLLPKLFRRHGFRTGVYDLSRDAVCRMYTSAGEVWRGLAKNATEGMASPLRLPFFTVLLFFGQVMPIAIVVWAFEIQHHIAFADALRAWQMGALAVLLSFGVRFVCAWRYKQSWRGALLHPLGVLVLLMLQWYALLRKMFRRPAVWKERKYQLG